MCDRHKLSSDVDIRTAKRIIRHRKSLSKKADLVWVFFLPPFSPVLLSKQCCPVNCVVSGFGPFSGCSASCGGGTQTRSRSIVTSPSCGGSGCPSLTVRKETKRDRVSFPFICFELRLWPYSVCICVCRPMLFCRTPYPVIPAAARKTAKSLLGPTGGSAAFLADQVSSLERRFACVYSALVV